MQLIHPKLANTVQKPPATTSQACRPPLGGGAVTSGARKVVGVDFSMSVGLVCEAGWGVWDGFLMLVGCSFSKSVPVGGG